MIDSLLAHSQIALVSKTVSFIFLAGFIQAADTHTSFLHTYTYGSLLKIKPSSQTWLGVLCSHTPVFTHWWPVSPGQGRVGWAGRRVEHWDITARGSVWHAFELASNDIRPEAQAGSDSKSLSIYRVWREHVWTHSPEDVWTWSGRGQHHVAYTEVWCFFWGSPCTIPDLRMWLGSDLDY